MKAPLRLLIQVPLREKREFRQMLLGYKNALCVRQIGEVMSFDLLPSFKPRKGQEHQLVTHLAEQLKQGWVLAVYDVERLKLELDQIVNGVSIKSAKLKSAVDEAWHVISTANDEQIIDIRLFEKLQKDHFVAMVASVENFDYDRVTPRFLRWANATSRPSGPICEDYWGVINQYLLEESEAKRALSAYKRWVSNNRPRPPREDAV